MSTADTKPGARIAPVERELGGGNYPVDTQEAFYQSLLNADWQYRGWRGGIYALFQEMEDRDAHLFSALQTRKNSLAGCGWKVVAASDAGRDTEIAHRVERILRGIPDFESAIFQMLDAIGKGWSVCEVIWHADVRRGVVEVAGLRPRAQHAFAMATDGRLHLLDEDAPVRMDAAARLIPRPGEFQVWPPRTRQMPERKFVRFVFQPSPGAPYGTPLCARAYWYYWYKKQNLKTWSLYNEKYGSPTAVARYSPTTTSEELTKLAEVVQGLQHDSGVVIPQDVALELLEARQSGAAGTYRELADWCNDEMSKLVLGQTLTTSEGRRSGSMALGQVHDRVRAEYLAADARALGAALSSQLVRWIVDFNFGAGEAAPRLVFDVANAAEFKGELELDEQLIRMGVPLPATYFYEKYRRPAPGEGERALRYDDANLYQYHLQFGVLTINEVRASLGLVPVAWGERPPVASTTGGPGAGREREGRARQVDAEVEGEEERERGRVR